jgi:hypothetical protein
MPTNAVRTLTPQMIALIANQAATAPHTLGLSKPRRPRVPAPLVPDAVHVTESPARVELTVGVKIESRANLDSSRPWIYRHRANKALDGTLGVLLVAKVPPEVRAKLAAGCIVRLTRIGPRRLDRDNLHAALKHVRDLIAQWLLAGRPGQRDEDARIDWREPVQEGRGKAYGLSVVIWESA